MTPPSRAGLVCAGAVAVVLSALTLAELRAGERALAASDGALAAHDLPTAIARARDAALSFVPGSPYPRAAYARLESIARDAEARGDGRIATLAWSAVRAAATATSSPLRSNEALRALADDGIAHAGVRPPVAANAAEITPSEPLLRGTLARDDVPSPLAFLVLGAGALAFFAGAARLAGVVRDLKALRREKLALALSVVGLAAYVIVSLRA